MLLSSDSGDFSVLFLQRIIPTKILHTIVITNTTKTGTTAPIILNLLLLEGKNLGVTKVERDIEILTSREGGDVTVGRDIESIELLTSREGGDVTVGRDIESIELLTSREGGDVTVGRDIESIELLISREGGDVTFVNRENNVVDVATIVVGVFVRIEEVVIKMVELMMMIEETVELLEAMMS